MLCEHALAVCSPTNEKSLESSAELVVTRVDNLGGTLTIFLDGKERTMKSDNSTMMKATNGDHNLDMEWSTSTLGFAKKNHRSRPGKLYLEL